VLGCAFFAGGVKWPEQRFNKNGAMTNSSLLCLAVMGVTLPNALHATHTELRGTVSELALSRFSATLLLIMYVVFLYFQLVSHTDFFEDEPVENESNNNNNNNNSSSFISDSKKDDDDNEIEEDEDSDDEDEDPELGFTESIYYMAAITLLISILSDVIVATIEGTARSWNCPVAFISVVMLPIVGNAAEHASAVMFALRNKMDISIGVAIGSSTQIAMFVFPFCVCVAWAMDKPLDLNMKVFETVSLVLCVVTVTFCIRDGKGNWLKGLTLILAYAILAASFFFHAEPPAEGLAGTSRFRIDG
jgi:Ca2+:H+ antiporter